MNCRFCKQSLEENELIDLGTSPASNAYLEECDLKKPESFFPLKVMVCSNCYLVQTIDYISREDLFNSHYEYFSSYSTSFLSHVETYVNQVVSRFNLRQDSTVIEVASNDGYLLQYFKDHNINPLGIEPTLSTAKVAKERGIETIVDFFGQKLARNLSQNGVKADLIIANNVLAHVPDLNDFIRGFDLILDTEGVITFEVPHLLKLMQYNQFDTIYHEHFSYFSLTTLKLIFNQNGLEIFDVEEITTHGGSLRVYLKKTSSKRAISPAVDRLMNIELNAGINSPGFYESFSARVQKIKISFLDFLVQHNDKKVIGYGAAAKGNTFLNYTGIGSDMISCVVDKNPHKVGKYLPGSRIPIVDETSIKSLKPEYIILFPWNLIDEIKEQLYYIKEWGGKLVTFIPDIQVHE